MTVCQKKPYVFSDLEEYVSMYLVPGDSVSFRLNTWNFDESLSFKGKGAKRNEFMSYCLLENETILQNTKKYLSFSESGFLNTIDSISDRRENMIKEILSEKRNANSKRLMQVANSYNLSLYYLKELYVKYSINPNIKFNPKLISHRESLNLNDSILLFASNIQEYLFTYLYNVSINKTDSTLTTSEKYYKILSTLKNKLDNS